MKALVLVDNISRVPTSLRHKLYVVSADNWQESFSFLEGKTTAQYLFLHETAPIERLLKLVEEYKGDLAVYTTQNVTDVFLSRFTRVVNRKLIEVTDADIAKFTGGSELEQKLKLIKGKMF